MAEFEELRLTVSLVDNASAGLAQLNQQIARLGGGTARDVAPQLAATNRQVGVLRTELRGLRDQVRGVEDLGLAFGKIGQAVGLIGRIGAVGGAVGIIAGITSKLNEFSKQMLDLQNISRIAGVLPDQFKNFTKQLEEFGYSSEQAEGEVVKFFRTIREASRAGTPEFRKIFTEAFDPQASIDFARRLQEMINRGEGGRALTAVAQQARTIFQRELTRPGGSRAEATRQTEAFLESFGLSMRALNIGRMIDQAGGDPQVWARRIQAAREWNMEWSKTERIFTDIVRDIQGEMLVSFRDLNGELAKLEPIARGLGTVFKVIAGALAQDVRDITGLVGVLTAAYDKVAGMFAGIKPYLDLLRRLPGAHRLLLGPGSVEDLVSRGIPKAPEGDLGKGLGLEDIGRGAGGAGGGGGGGPSMPATPQSGGPGLGVGPGIGGGGGVGGGAPPGVGGGAPPGVGGGAPSSGLPGAGAPAGGGGGRTGALPSNAAGITEGLIQRGFSREQAAAVTGNIGAESSFDPSSVNQIGASGLMQWLGPRKQGLMNYAKATGRDWRDQNTQLDYIAQERAGTSVQYGGSNEAANYQKAFQSGNVGQMARDFGRYVERPSARELAGSLGRRVGTAESAYSGLPNGSDVGAGTGTGAGETPAGYRAFLGGGGGSLAPTGPRGYQRRGGEPGEFNAGSEFGAPGPQNQTMVTLANGQSIKVNKNVAERYRGFFNEMIERGYPVDVRGGGGFAQRGKRGGGGLSMHAYGTAADINVAQNPFRGRTTDMPEDVETTAWKHGLSWGGRFGDPMHFEAMGQAAWESKRRQLQARGLPAEPDRREIDRSMGREVTSRVEGRGQIDVNVKAPRGTRVNASGHGLFKRVAMNRQVQMEPASSGPPEPQQAAAAGEE